MTKKERKKRCSGSKMRKKRNLHVSKMDVVALVHLVLVPVPHEQQQKRHWQVGSYCCHVMFDGVVHN